MTVQCSYIIIFLFIIIIIILNVVVFIKCWKMMCMILLVLSFAVKWEFGEFLFCLRTWFRKIRRWRNIMTQRRRWSRVWSPWASKVESVWTRISICSICCRRIPTTSPNLYSKCRRVERPNSWSRPFWLFTITRRTSERNICC